MPSAWDMDGRKSIPTHSACGETNSVDHSLICKPSSYTSMRHNSVRDSGAQIMRKVCRDVQTEPTLFPINKNNFEIKVDFANNARLDISVRGLWNTMKKRSLTWGSPILPYSLILISSLHRSTNNMKKEEENVQLKSGWHWEVFNQSRCLYNKWWETDMGQ